MSDLNYSEIQLEDLERSVEKHKRKEEGKSRSDRYAEAQRDDNGWIAPQEHIPKQKPYTTAQAMAELDKGPKKMHYTESRKWEHRKKEIRWRNHYKFVGVLPDFRGFEKLKMTQIIPTKHFREKRTFINILEWLKPDEMLMRVGKVCKKFYMLTWNEELLNKMAHNNFGAKGINEIKFRIAKRMHQVATGNLPMVNGKEKERWMVETETSSESSGFWTSHDEEDAHMRHDARSSAEEENTLKDFLRRNAREERDLEKKAKEKEKQREMDMKVIERLQNEKLPIPQKYKDLYGNDLSEMNYNIPHDVANFIDSKSGKPTNKLN